MKMIAIISYLKLCTPRILLHWILAAAPGRPLSRCYPWQLFWNFIWTNAQYFQYVPSQSRQSGTSKFPLREFLSEDSKAQHALQWVLSALSLWGLNISLLFTSNFWDGCWFQHRAFVWYFSAAIRSHFQAAKALWLVLMQPKIPCRIAESAQDQQKHF